jgi:Tol biopolymer transport system component
MKFILYPILLIATLFGQIKITSVEKIPISSNEQWSYPVYSPSGKEIYLTNSLYNGIWQYVIETKLLREITRDPGSGYNFAISSDCRKIAYRRTLIKENSFERKQEIILLDVVSLQSEVFLSGNDIQTPVFIQNELVVTDLQSKKTIFSEKALSQTALLGSENSKIIVSINREKKVIDPFENGQYLWQSLSPDRSKLVAIEMDRGAFICDLNGKNIVKIGRCDSPKWTRSGQWVIGMNDLDDGHKIVSSEIVAVSADGTKRIQLTDTPESLELYPSCSALSDSFVVCTANGEILVYTYAEGK